MKQFLTKPLGNLVIGVAFGAIVVGAVWYGVWTFAQHGGDIAKVGNKNITRADFLAQMESTSGTQTLNQLITSRIIEDGAKKYNISASTSEVDNALKSFEAQYGITSDAQLQTALAASGMTMAQLQQNMRTEVLEQKLAERNVTVSDNEIQDYYNQNKSQLASSGKVPALKDIKSEIVSAIKQSKATPPQQLLASLAKDDNVQIYDPKYSSVKTNLENPTATTAASGQ